MYALLNRCRIRPSAAPVGTTRSCTQDEKERMMNMATKSILKNVTIKDRRSTQRLVSALENAHGKRSQDVQHQRSHSDASREDIRKMFGGSNDRV